jgi:hypothetical protein
MMNRNGFRGLRPFLIIAAAAFSLPAAAQEGRDLCSDRPGLGTPACTVAKGEVVAELGLADWTRQHDGSVRTDTLLLGDMLLRFGLSSSLEAQVGWTALGRVRERDAALGTRGAATRVGDVTLALRQNIRNPDGSGLSVAIMPYVTLPAGRTPVGTGDWSGGVRLPVSVDLGGGASFALTPEVDAAVDEDGDGRHLQYGSVAGMGFDLSDHVSASAELSLFRDRDPAGHSSEALAGLSLGWQPNDDSQWDVGANVGLNRDSPDVELYLGYVHRF